MAPSFYKILLDPSTRHLSLPPEYVTMHLVNKIRNNPIIRSANGGYSWRLKIKQIGDDYCFVDGWNNVVKDIQLGFGDFLLFKLVDQSTFRMSIYSPDGCEKILQPKTDQNGCEKILTPKILHDDDDEDVSGEFENVDDDPFFVKTFTKSHIRRLRFPKEFAAKAGINCEGTMRVKNLDGGEWVTDVKLDTTFKTKRYLLSSGWWSFRRGNNLSEGDKCVFKFIKSERKLLLAKVTKKK
ncbi:B3 domain-containing protein REM9-like [Helianthus annuus]|uniref:B3 domain-containing protein REM9-like n=1 Tax=Helianthus annuus TaxID=4232 RepID=UPI000B9055A5|nr:B3 domain-containing protein REM9-like [Helianthus annuus]